MRVRRCPGQPSEIKLSPESPKTAPDFKLESSTLRQQSTSAVQSSRQYLNLESSQTLKMHLNKQKSSSTPRRSPVSRLRDKTPRTAAQTKTCRYCRRRNQADRKACPAFGKTCQSCGKSNHFAAVCRSKPVQILATKSRQFCRCSSNLLVAGEEVQFMLDSGATINLLPSSIAQLLNSPKFLQKFPVQPAKTALHMFDGTELKVRGTVNLPVINPRT